MSDSKWIPVGERLPEAYVTVLMCIADSPESRDVASGYISDTGNWVAFPFGVCIPVTHWQPLPAPPSSTQTVGPLPAQFDIPEGSTIHSVEMRPTSTTVTYTPPSSTQEKGER